MLVELEKKCSRIDHLNKDDGEFQKALALREHLPDQAQDTPKKTNIEERGKGKNKKSQTGYGPTPQPRIKQTEQLFLLDEADLACPDYGHELKVIDE